MVTAKLSRPLTFPKSRAISEEMILSGLRSGFGMDADDFCDRWFGLDSLPEKEREKVKTSWGHRAKRVKLLSEILQKPPKTVGNWGANFERMPEDCRPALIYADALRLQLKAAPEVLVNIFLENRKTLQNL
jgi:hypothetical protein